MLLSRLIYIGLWNAEYRVVHEHMHFVCQGHGVYITTTGTMRPAYVYMQQSLASYFSDQTAPEGRKHLHHRSVAMTIKKRTPPPGPKKTLNITLTVLAASGQWQHSTDQSLDVQRSFVSSYLLGTGGGKLGLTVMRA